MPYPWKLSICTGPHLIISSGTQFIVTLKFAITIYVAHSETPNVVNITFHDRLSQPGTVGFGYSKVEFPK